MRTRAVAAVFPFQKLPPEIRNMIYELALDFDSLHGYFRLYIEKMNEAHRAEVHPDKISPPHVHVHTPGILLVNREISHEARSVLYRKPLVFSNGLIKAHLSDIMSEELITRVTHLRIDDAGGDLLEKKFRGAPFLGYLNLFKELSGLLKGPHSLKSLEIEIQNADFAWHLTHCLNNPRHYYCGMNGFVNKGKTFLRRIHGIQNVTLKGVFTQSIINDVISELQAPASPFLRLPGELRNQIYDGLLNWNEASNRFNKRIQAQITLNADRLMPPQKRTPSILLLNRQITSEARAILHKKPIVIDFKIDPQRLVLKNKKLPSLFNFFSRGVFQTAPRVVLKMNHSAYAAVIPELAKAWEEKHNLRRFKLHFIDDLKNTFLNGGSFYPDENMSRKVSSLAKVRGVRSASITGSLWGGYCVALEETMESSHGEVAEKLFSANKDGELKQYLGADAEPSTGLF